MKIKGLLFLLLCWALYGKAQQAKDVFISGKFINLNNRTTVLDLSETGALRPPNNDKEIAPDSEGNFSINFKLKQPNYFWIGKNVVYLSPGDRMKVMIDNLDPGKSTFYGSGSFANYYLESIPYPKAGSYLEGGINLKKTLIASIDFVLFLAQERRNKLQALPSVTPEFVRLENARIDADIISSFKWLPGIFIRENKIPKENQAEIYKEAHNLTLPYVNKYVSNLQKADFLKIVVVRDNFYWIMDSLKDVDANTARIKDWQRAYELVYYINGSHEKKDLLKLKPAIDSIKDTEYRNAAKESFDLKAGFWNGDTAIDFHAFDINHQTISLSRFKGAVIYIDLWATWCEPCLKDMSFLDSLRNKYANNPNIIFVSLCMNENIADWEKYLQKQNLKGIQLLADISQMKPYNIHAIPRVVVIDKNFKVLLMDGPLPSNPVVLAYLDGLLKNTHAK